jgi:hypothetical protein
MPRGCPGAFLPKGGHDTGVSYIAPSNQSVGSLQGILKGEVSLYCWPPVWPVWISPFCKYKQKIVSYHTADSKPVKQEVNRTVILPPLVFPGSLYFNQKISPSSIFVTYGCSFLRGQKVMRSNLNRQNLLRAEWYRWIVAAPIYITREQYSIKWKRINCKQSARWQHLSRLKASTFLFEKYFVRC